MSRNLGFAPATRPLRNVYTQKDSLPMSKQILIDSCFGLVRTAIAQGTHLLDYYEESPDQGRSKGNIYRGVVKRVDGNIQAAFVRYGSGRDGFLPLRDADAVSAVGGTLRVGDPVLVQVVKDEVGEKGAALTAKISLSGRYLVFIPGREGEGGISSRIGDEERSALKKILGEMQLPEGGSVILRTAALNKGVSELQADLDRLAETHREIMDNFGKGKEPALLFREATPALRYLREYYSSDVEKIWVNEEDVLEQCRQFFFLYEPKSASKVTLSKEGPLMFQKLGLEAEVDKLSLRKVPLPSGANIVIDQTEALVAIDVNSAKAGGRGDDSHHQNGLEETVFAVNKEAAVEISRQLRLRDLGGIIVVDFIDMEEERHRRQIEEIMRRSLASDKAKVKVFEISPLGTLQISRQRLRKAGPNFSRHSCEVCNGRGWHTSAAVGAFAVLRRMEERLLGKKSAGGLTVAVPYPVANELLNDFRAHIVSMEQRFGCSIRVSAQPAQIGDPVFASLGAAGEGGERNREGGGRSREEGVQARGDGRRGSERNEGRNRDGNRNRNPRPNQIQNQIQNQNQNPNQVPREVSGRPVGIGESNRVEGEGGRRRRSRRGGRHADSGLARGNAPRGPLPAAAHGPRVESELTPPEERISHLPEAARLPERQSDSRPPMIEAEPSGYSQPEPLVQVPSFPSTAPSVTPTRDSEDRRGAPDSLDSKRPPARRRSVPAVRSGKEPAKATANRTALGDQAGKGAAVARKSKPSSKRTGSAVGAPAAAPVRKSKPAGAGRPEGGRAKPDERVRVEVLAKEPKVSPAEAKTARSQEGEGKSPRLRSRPRSRHRSRPA